MNRILHRHKFILGLVICSSIASFGFSATFRSAAAAPRTPIRSAKPGSTKRKAIFDALRGPVSAGPKTQITFTKAEVKIAGNWAYVTAETVDQRGRKVGIKEMGNYNHLQALLSGGGKSWRVREWAYPTDVISLEWERRYPNVSKALWPHTAYGVKR